MNILDRYFIREFFKPLLACLVAFLLLMLVHDLNDNYDDFIQAHTPARQIFHYYMILMPAWIVDIMPISLLLALLYTLSTMSKYGELTAMRASGLDFVRLMGPYFVIGICLTIQILCINLAWAPGALLEAKLIFEKNTNKTQAPTSKTLGVTYYDVIGNRFWFASMVNPVEQIALGVEVTQSDQHQKDVRKISAASGSYRHGHWTFRNVKIADFTKTDWDPGFLTILDTLEVAEFTESPQQFIASFQKTKRVTTHDLIQSLKHAARLSPRKRSEIRFELYSRISFPLFNFIVFLIGIPFGVVGQRRSNVQAIANAFMLFFGYMILRRVLETVGMTGRIPVWFAAWFPSVLFAAVGVYLIRRIR